MENEKEKHRQNKVLPRYEKDARKYERTPIEEVQGGAAKSDRKEPVAIHYARRCGQDADRDTGGRRKSFLTRRSPSPNEKKESRKRGENHPEKVLQKK